MSNRMRNQHQPVPGGQVAQAPHQVRNRRAGSRDVGPVNGEEHESLTKGYSDVIQNQAPNTNSTRRKKTGLGLTADESVISPLDTDQPRLYSYDYGSDGEAEVDNRRGPRWERGSQSSMSDSLSHCSGSDNEGHEADIRAGQMSTLPMPRMPPPPPEEPPPLDGQPLDPRHHFYNPALRPPGGAPGMMGAPMMVGHQPRLSDDPSSSIASPLNHNYYLVSQSPTSSITQSDGSQMYPSNTIPGRPGDRSSLLLPGHGGPTFPRTVPKTGLPHRPIQEPVPDPPMGYPGCHQTLDGRMVPDHYESLTSLNTPQHIPHPHSQFGTSHKNSTHLERPPPEPFTHPSMISPAVPIPSYSPVQNDFRNYGSKLGNTGFRVKKHIRTNCSWKLTVFILILLLVIMAAILAYLAASTYLNKDTTPVDGDNTFRGATMSSGEAPETVQLGRPLFLNIPAYSFWLGRLFVTTPEPVQFNFTISRHAVIGFYGRWNREPSHLRNDFSVVFDGNKMLERKKRTTDARSIFYMDPANRNTSYHRYLEEGWWYVALYNDDSKPNKVALSTGLHDVTSDCMKTCSNRGYCENNKCICYPGRTGPNCEHESCPVLCSGHGIYDRGTCRCFTEWKGSECSVPADECQVPKCNGNGDCVSGSCVCKPGWSGDDCGNAVCLTPNCSGHGVCLNQTCQCFKGYRGQDCELEEVVAPIAVCTKNCSGHGLYDKAQRKCVCDNGWSGEECETEVCMLHCSHGRCENRRCVCDKDWTGYLCDQLMCDKRCQLHGYCDNGTCHCKPGWNGKHCSLDGCPNACNNHGTCQQFLGGWRCSCQNGWKGRACDVAMETSCDDADDNDNDGLADCIDPDCCVSFACRDSTHCTTSPDPMEILLRKQPPGTTASFYDKMKFLIEEDSVQRYSTKNFNESQVSVIRGRVIAKDGSPLIGVRISVPTQPMYGFTLTRDQGLFDLLVNGGGSVTLSFLRQPFKTKAATVTVPWNRLITMDTVVMTLGDDLPKVPEPCPNIQHDHYTMRPLVLSTWEHTQLGSCSSSSAVIPESQVLQESLSIPGSAINLVYHSSETSGYMSTIMIQLTPDGEIPDDLAIVFLRIAVQGLTYEKTFEADAGLKYKFAWDRLNCYNQNIYGIVNARVSVGYKYQACEHIFWETQSATMSGYDMPSSNIGHWNLDVHHMYNYQEGILHKGDGTNIYLKEKPKKIITILGNGKIRKSDCRGCDGPPEENRLLAPVALASGLDGSLYVGDYNFVRKLSASRQSVTSILEMRASGVPYKYFMTVSPLDGKLYISDYENRRVIQVKTMGGVRELRSNHEVIAGSGEECLPGEKEKCGDGGRAAESRLRYPKGIAINKDGVIYFADGANIRTVDRAGIIRTIIGDQDQPGEWRPMPCHQAVKFEDMTLRWPTAMAVNPLDDTVHVLDNKMVLKLTHDNKVIIVAGRAVLCPPKYNQSRVVSLDEIESSRFATDEVLHHPQHISFSPNGDLYIVESDERYTNRIRIVTTDGRIYHHVGAKSKCDCKLATCKCFDPRENLASQSLLKSPTSITVTPDGVLHISDMGNLRVHSVMAILPKLTKLRQYEVLSPETQELYIFNRHGQHMHTQNIITGEYMYNFTYNVPASYGRLIKVTGAGNNHITITRDYENMPTDIRAPNGQRCKLEMDNMGRLVKFVTPDGFATSFRYLDTMGLLASKHTDSGQTYFYEYDSNGRLSRVIQPTGNVMSIRTDVDTTGAVAKIFTDRNPDITLATNGNQLSILHGVAKSKISYDADGSLLVEFPSQMAVTLEASPHPLLTSEHQFHIRRKIILARNLVHRLQWRYYIRRNRQGRKQRRIDTIGRWMRVKRQSPGLNSPRPSMSELHDVGSNGKVLTRRKVNSMTIFPQINGENLISVAYSRPLSQEYVMDVSGNVILTITYNRNGQPISFSPPPSFKPVNLTYNAHGQLQLWRHGDLTEEYTYDEHSRLTKRKVNEAMYRYIYRDYSKPSVVILPSRKQYLFHYDRFGNMDKVTCPNTGMHQFHTLTTLGFQRKVYTPPGSKGAYIQDFDSHGRISKVLYPSGTKRIVYTYDQDQKLSRIFYDRSDVSFDYHSDYGTLDNVTVLDRAREFQCTLRFKTIGTLIGDQTVEFDKKVEPFKDAHFQYHHDNSFRTVSFQAKIGDHVYRHVNTTYGQSNGRLQKMRSFSFEYPQMDKHVIRDINVQIVREFDSYGRLRNMYYKFNNYVVYTLHLQYDSLDRVMEWKRQIGDMTEKKVEYVYDIDNNIVRVLEDSATRWQYSYDVNGNMETMTDRTNTPERLQYNERDQIESFDGVQYRFDKDGFLVQRGDEIFEYNSYGQMFHARLSNIHDIYYYYDAYNRLVARKEFITDSLIQYFYGDVINTKRITHVYNHTDKELSMLFYDSDGKLFAMERDNRNFYIAQDPMGATVVIFNSVGQVVKTNTYGTSGLLESESNPHFNYPFGYKGGVYDQNTHLVFIEGRVFDPRLSRWSTPDYGKLFSLVERAVYTPEVMNFYQFQQPINSHWTERKDRYLKDIPSWLAVLGYDLDSILPTISFTGSIRHQTITSTMTDLMPVVSAFQCAFERDVTVSSRISSVPRSKVATDLGPETIKAFGPFKSIFGDGVVISDVENKVLVNLLEDVGETSRRLATVLLNDSLSLGLHYTINGKDIHYFVKEELSQARLDLDELDINDDRAELNNGINITVNRGQRRRRRQPELPFVDIRLHGNHTVLNIRYGTDLDNERHRVLRHARERAVEHAWGRERELILTGLKGQRDWLTTEREQLLNLGRVPGYRGDYIRENIPSLADDPQNIVFVPIS